MRRPATIEAIEDVYRRRGAEFFRFALARLADSGLAQDAVQEGFARALRGRSGFRGSGDLEAWLARCVINAATDARQNQGSVPHGDLGASAETDFAGVDGAVRDAIRRLPQRQRDALFLRFYLDLDYRSIAEALQIEVGTVSATLSAARTTLSRTLQGVA